MIEVFKEHDMFRWFMISEAGMVQVIGDLHETDVLAHKSAVQYRTKFRELAAEVDSYSL